MANVQKPSVELAPETVAMLDDAVKTGEYASTSEAVRDAPRLWRSRRAEETLDAEGIAPALERRACERASAEGEKVFSRLREKYAKQAAGG